MAAYVNCKFGSYRVSTSLEEIPRQVIQIEPCSQPVLFDVSPEEENRVMRLLLYDLLMGYTTLSDIVRRS